jgi:hypothetical protein
MMRVLMSGADPAGSDTRSLTGRDGKAVCASAGKVTVAATEISAAAIATGAATCRHIGLTLDSVIGASLRQEALCELHQP